MELHPERLGAVERVILELQRRHPHRDADEIETLVRAEFVSAEVHVEADPRAAAFIPSRVLVSVENHLRATRLERGEGSR